MGVLLLLSMLQIIKVLRSLLSAIKLCKQTITAIILLLLTISSSYALPSSKLYINSDHLTINQQTQKAHFTGEVILWFDGMMVKTSKLEVTYKIVAGKRTIDYIEIPTNLTAKKEQT